MKWTKDKDDQLIKLCQEYRTIDDIASILGVTKAAIDNRKAKLGLRGKFRPSCKILLNSELVENFKILYNKGLGYIELSNELKIPLSQVNFLIEELNLKRQTRYMSDSETQQSHLRKYTDDIILKIKFFIQKKGFTHQETADNLGFKKDDINYVCQRYNIKSPNVNRKWSEEESRKFIELLENKVSIDEICVQLSRTDVALVSRAEKLKIISKYQYLLDKKNENKNNRYTLRKILKQKIKFAQRRCKEKGWKFDIDLEYMLSVFERQKGLCHYTGEKLSWKPSEPNTLSIDRPDSSRGYERDNVVLCIWDINRMKQDMDLQRYVELCKIISSRY